MRKKLLALMMCATMVLGTGVTAFADTTTDTVNKILDNNSKFFKEVDANGVNGAVKDSVQVVTKKADGTVEVNTVNVRYTQKAPYSAVVMFTNDEGKDKTATYVNDTVDASEANYSTTLAAVKAALSGKANGNYAVNVTTKAGALGTYLYAVDGSDVTVKNDGKTTSFVEGTTNWVKVDAGTKTLSANSKILASTSNTFGKVLTIVEQLSDTDKSAIKTTLYDGVLNNTISDKAFAVKLTPIVQETEFKTLEIAGVSTFKDNSVQAAKVAKVYNDNWTNFVGGTYTLDSDLISNTPLKSAAALDVYKFTGYDAQYSQLLGVIPALLKVGTADVDKTYSFDNINTMTGIFVFDEGTAADSKDGVSEDTTTAANSSANNSASPKTGDVAPIAALAVVMMGACGAMVVASKKRA